MAKNILKKLFAPDPEDRLGPGRLRKDEQPEAVDPIELIESGKLTRYRVRNLIYRLRDKRVESKDGALATAIWDIIEKQLKPEEYLKDFTFKWDVNPFAPLQVIRKEDWYQLKRQRYPKLYKKEVFDEESRLYSVVDKTEDEKEIVDKSVAVEEELRLFTRQG